MEHFTPFPQSLLVCLMAYKSFLNLSLLLLGISKFVVCLCCFFNNTVHLISFMDKLPWPQETIIIWRLDGENMRIKQCWITGHTAYCWCIQLWWLHWIGCECVELIQGYNVPNTAGFLSIPLYWEDFTDPSSCLLVSPSVLLLILFFFCFLLVFLLITRLV